MEVRAAALRRFGENNIRVDAPLSTIEDALVPIYLLHRYQVESATKLVGGMDYTFALRGDGQAPTQIVGAAEQRRCSCKCPGNCEAGCTGIAGGFAQNHSASRTRLRTRPRAFQDSHQPGI